MVLKWTHVFNPAKIMHIKKGRFLVRQCEKEAGCVQKAGQDVVGRVVSIKKIVPLWPSHHLLHLKQPLISHEEERSTRKSGRRDSNPRQPAWKAGTLPTELLPLT